MLKGKLGKDNISKCIYPGEIIRYWLAVLIILPIIFLYVLMTYGFGLLIVPFTIFFAWFFVRILRAHLLGSCAEVSEDNFPQIYILLEQIRQYLDYPKKVEVYVYQDGDVNAFLIRRFRTRIILLPHELLVGMLEGKGQIELVWVLSRAVGHLKAKHLRLWWLNILIESFEKLFFLNLFLLPWERSTQYSGDRIGLAVCTDLHAALRAMNKLMLGNALSRKTTLLGALKQRQKLQGSIFAWLAECLSTHPHLTKRIASLIEWTHEYNASMYKKFTDNLPNIKQLESFLPLEADS